ncbi:MAG TPA: SRPBCC family protein [Acidimicrobiales bacterium]|jgi:ribosome-associated toxin RatA of RatAB toxin-antitoxin module|nr:SRPBCC family protein [Acidimicrobiales bacterium]
MSDKATEKMVMRADPDRLYQTVLDFERYPEWAGDIKQVHVLERDDEGRGTVVSWRAAAFGRSTSYTLRYDYAEAPRAVSWVLDHGDITSKLDGAYRFEPAGEGTEVTYLLEADLTFPLPGFVKRRAEQRIISTALKELRARVEKQ